MFMTQCILKSIISFLGIENYDYIHIKIKGFGIVIKYLSRVEASEIIADNDLELYKNYPGLGKVYDDGKFRNYVNNHPRIKRLIFRFLNNIENAY